MPTDEPLGCFAKPARRLPRPPQRRRPPFRISVFDSKWRTNQGEWLQRSTRRLEPLSLVVDDAIELPVAASVSQPRSSTQGSCDLALMAARRASLFAALVAASLLSGSAMDAGAKNQKALEESLRQDLSHHVAAPNPHRCRHVNQA